MKIEDFDDHRYPGSNWAGKVGRSEVSGPPFSIYVPCEITKLIRDVVAAQWQAAGHVLVEQNQNLTVTGHIKEFKASMSAGTILGYRAATVLDVIVEIQDGTTGSNTLTRQYRSEHEEQWVLVSDFTEATEAFEVTLSACLEDLMRQIASDAEVVRFLSDRPTGAATAS